MSHSILTWFIMTGVTTTCLLAGPRQDVEEVHRRTISDWIGTTREERLVTAVRPALESRSGEGPSQLPMTIDDGLAWLSADQNVDGSWGSSFPLIVTGAVLETLAPVDPCGPQTEAGALWLATNEAPNNDFLARQTTGLAGLPAWASTAKSLAEQLLEARNPVEPNPALPNWPEGGWGLAEGFESDCQTTSLAMLALDGTGFNGGFVLTDEPLTAGATNVHEWEISDDATKVRILITVSGSEVRLCMTEGAPPPFCSSFFILPPGPTFEIVFPDNAPFTPGTNFVVVESTGPAASYTMTASYETPTFDTRSLAEPLNYLRQSQNPDGGWGLQRGQPTEAYTTYHVILALLRYAPYSFDAEIAAAIAHLKSLQLPDGSFGFGGSTVPYATALASLGLVRAETPNFSTETADAISALTGLQEPDGSWDQEAYDTALAMLALWEHGLPPTADAGPDQIVTDADENCFENVSLSGSGTASNGTITSYTWTEDCVQIATGSMPTVPLPFGSHTLVLTVTDSSGYTASDDVTIMIDSTTPCADTDADGILNDGNFSGTEGDAPCPDGVTTGCDDNCPLASNPDQAETDGDLFGDACDCDPTNDQVWLVPGQSELSLAYTAGSGQVDLSWTVSDPGGLGSVVYDLLASPDASDFLSAVCLESDDGDTMAIDTDVIVPGEVRFYLVRGENACPLIGSLGTDSDGFERTGTACP